MHSLIMIYFFVLHGDDFNKPHLSIASSSMYRQQIAKRINATALVFQGLQRIEQKRSDPQLPEGRLCLLWLLDRWRSEPTTSLSSMMHYYLPNEK